VVYYVFIGLGHFILHFPAFSLHFILDEKEICVASIASHNWTSNDAVGLHDNCLTTGNSPPKDKEEKISKL
jgi:hypothetical protein